MAYMVEVPWLIWVCKVGLVFTLVLWTKLNNNENKVIGPEEIPILVLGRRKRPQTKMGST